MDTNICGLNKVVCIDHALEHEGEKVTISNGVNTYEKEIIDGVATFLIPSIPAPAKRPYTVELKDVYTTEIELGFGDSIVVGLDTSYEVATKGALEELGLVVGKNTTDIAKNKQAISDNTGAIDELALLANGLKLNGTGSVFQFALSNGQYGYRVGGPEGTFRPFKTGAESFCYLLGTGNSFDVKAKCSSILANDGIAIDYTKLTNNNFIVVTSGASTSGINYTEMQAYAGCGVWAGGSFSAASHSYNPSNGILTAYNASVSAHVTVGHGSQHNGSGASSPTVYLVNKR